MTNYPSDFDTARAIRDAQNGSMVAKVALMAVSGEPNNWPQAYCDAAVAEYTPDDDDAPHVGHYSRLGGTWWCDTCDSPYCELA